jgi:hypothetical protein
MKTGFISPGQGHAKARIAANDAKGQTFKVLMEVMGHV